MNTSAVEQYITEIQRCKEALDRINEYIEDNGEVGPDEINWGHTGSMQHIANELTQLQHMIDGTGEYAE